MAQIHPTATVDDSARLADDARVGPFCRVTGPVELGAGAQLLPHVTVCGPVKVGPNAVVYPGVGLEASDGGAIEIGPDSILREYAGLTSTAEQGPTVLGQRVYIMANSRIAGGVSIGDDATIVNSVHIGAGTQVAQRVTIGGGAIIGPNLRIGQMAMIAGVVEVDGHVPPYAMVFNSYRFASLNLVGLRRGGYRDQIGPLRQAFAMLFRKGMDRGQALEAIEAAHGQVPIVAEFARFVRDAGDDLLPYQKKTAQDAA